MSLAETASSPPFTECTHSRIFPYCCVSVNSKHACSNASSYENENNLINVDIVVLTEHVRLFKVAVNNRQFKVI